jgi:hypothetical protein
LRAVQGHDSGWHVGAAVEFAVICGAESDYEQTHFTVCDMMRVQPQACIDPESYDEKHTVNRLSISIVDLE